MSVLLEFSMFPMDKGESISPYVSRILAMIDTSGVSYRFTPMGTIVETETIDEALRIMREAYATLEPDCNRVSVLAKFDIRKGKGGRLEQKVASVEQKVGRKLKT
jgi:uncharacterized protein (TIGR00106 family)